ncbi:hypothetical protein [Pelagibius sp. Alg239-R121]|uniref:hypothetical protein n=1 Tax=Pelagibius sp. Alg239-R121 TaxID=2993448 RepID=UPI0024A79126|nr:hypothetical protein [Pelagibius sp. Alg239-R121]
MQRFLLSFLAAVIPVISLSGCESIKTPALLPEKQALAEVHDVYRQEFAELFLSGQGEEPQCLANLPSANQPTFSRTRSAIRAYRVRFGSKQAEAAHLTVLDAMMHLQVGNVGLARLLESDVETAKGNLVSKTGRFTRDFLFAEHFGALIEGWRVVCDLTATPAKEVERAAERLETAAEEIGDGLTEAAKSGQLAEPDADQGAIYLATTAAIFNVWAIKERGQLCIEQGMCGCEAGESACPSATQTATACAAETAALDRLECHQNLRRDYFNEMVKPERYVGSRDLIGLFLDDSEKKLANCAAADAMTRSTSSSRLRYLSWYKFFHERLPAASTSEACPS